MATQNTEISREPSALTERQQQGTIAVQPPVDIYENNDELLLVADLPGVPKDALNVRLDGTELTIEGAQPAEAQAGAAAPLSFTRAFRVPNTVDPAGVRAELTQGVLRVHLAKSEAAKPRRIEIQGE